MLTGVIPAQGALEAMDVVTLPAAGSVTNKNYLIMFDVRIRRAHVP